MELVRLANLVDVNHPFEQSNIYRVPLFFLLSTTRPDRTTVQMAGATRINSRVVRFAIFASILVLLGFILSRGSATSYSLPSGLTSDTSQSTGSSPKSESKPSSQGSSGATELKKTYTTDGKEKATFVSLARNSDVWSLASSIRHVEDRFNHKFHYDWVFLNDEEFSDEFKRVTSALTSGKAKYGLIPKEHWSFPEWIDKERAAKTRKEMAAKKVIYGDSISYRHMCRFESGFFFRHELMQEYEWYWRVEPDIKIFCDIDYDVFKFMKDNNKMYGFTVSLPEYVATIETLWDTTRAFIKENPQYLPEDNMMDFISDDDGLSYNGCHFWSNFEVGSLSLWRSEAYLKYFDHLDKAGGFFYERWGDAPVHSIAAALFLHRDQIHFFDDVGYFHSPFNNCPVDADLREERRCMCNPKDDFTWKGYSCVPEFFTVNNMKRPKGWEAFSG